MLCDGYDGFWRLAGNCDSGTAVSAASTPRFRFRLRDLSSCFIGIIGPERVVVEFYRYRHWEFDYAPWNGGIAKDGKHYKVLK